MPYEFKLPELGENIDSATVVSLLVKEGDTIAAETNVVELETGKAVVELPCPQAGRVGKILIKAGDKIAIGAPLMTIETSGAVPAADKPAPRPAVPPPPPPAIKPPQVSVRVGNGATAPPPTPTTPAVSAGGLIAAGPAARRLARELGTDLRRIAGSGPRGRITPDDVRTAAAGEAQSAPRPVAPRTRGGVPGEDRFGPVRREALSEIRTAIAAQMVRSATVIPHVTNFDDADITELDHMRRGIRPGQLGENVKLSVMPFVMRAVALALNDHPLLNCSLNTEKNEIIYKDYVNLGVAVDTPRGLVVPVVRGADKLTIPDIARTLSSIAERARKAQFTMDDLRGGTFTISNLGAVGGTYSTPIINHPEAAILLLGRSRLLPAVVEGQVEPRLFLPLSLSYDHRVVDGAVAGRFLNEVIDFLQSPGRLLLSV